ncbi:MAG: LPS assembly lipoprotein LptE [Bryobacterales bacterium]
MGPLFVAHGAALLAVTLSLPLWTASCGYRTAGSANMLPDTIHSISIPPFENATTEYKIEQNIRSAVVSEFITRTRYHIVTDDEGADATLHATILLFRDFPATYDPQSNRASTVQTETHLHVALRDHETGQVVYENPRMILTETYEVSIDPQAYFGERQAAIQRSGRSAAREMVSAILSGF